MCDCANRTFFAHSDAINQNFRPPIKVFVHILKFSPAKNHKETFLLSYFSVKKSTKSHLRGFSILLKISFRVHELVAGSSAWQVRAAKDKSKVVSFALPAISHYHACEHSARGSRADSCTHCLHARYKCRAGVGLVPALTRLSK